ncbi:Hypothetical_protein [Hexamita inflata]|uniref:Hypothetical_protein n=1 Tax=Hexamita inflata TaxID=28002 RepID=A0ABP1IYT9_9EUKA
MQFLAKLNEQPVTLVNGHFYPLKNCDLESLPNIVPCLYMFAKSNLIEVSTLCTMLINNGISRCVLNVTTFITNLKEMFDEAQFKDICNQYFQFISSLPVKFYIQCDFEIPDVELFSNSDVIVQEVQPALLSEISEAQVQFAQQTTTLGLHKASIELINQQIKTFGSSDFINDTQVLNFRLVGQSDVVKPIAVYINAQPLVSYADRSNVRISSNFSRVFLSRSFSPPDFAFVQDFYAQNKPLFQAQQNLDMLSLKLQTDSFKLECESYAQFFAQFIKLKLNNILVLDQVSKQISIHKSNIYEEMNFLIKVNQKVIINVQEFQNQFFGQGHVRKLYTREIELFNSFITNVEEQILFWAEEKYFVVHYENAEEFVLLEKFVQENTKYQKINLKDVLDLVQM